MTVLTNPAGRLHRWLHEWNVARNAMTNQSAVQVWNAVLQGSHRTVGMSRIAGLIVDIDSAARRYEEHTGDSSLVKTTERYRDEWAEPLFYSRVGKGAALNAHDAVSDDAMLALNTVSSVLQYSQPEGRALTDEASQSLRSDLDALIAQVREDEELDPQLQLLILTRLHDVASALDHYEVTGPDGVAAAGQRLAATIAFEVIGDPTAKTRVQAVMKFAGQVIQAVAFIGSTSDAATAIETGMKSLGM